MEQESNRSQKTESSRRSVREHLEEVNQQQNVLLPLVSGGGSSPAPSYGSVAGSSPAAPTNYYIGSTPAQTVQSPPQTVRSSPQVVDSSPESVRSPPQVIQSSPEASWYRFRTEDTPGTAGYDRQQRIRKQLGFLLIH